MLEYTLKAINTLLEACAITCCHQVVLVGYENSMKLLHLWQRKIADGVKREIIRFFTLQLVVQRNVKADVFDTSCEVRLYLHLFTHTVAVELRHCIKDFPGCHVDTIQDSGSRDRSK